VSAGLAQISDYYGNAVVGTSDATCTFGQPFSAPPIVLSALQSNANTALPDFLTASQYGVSASQFSCAIEVPDGETREPDPEVIGWVGVDPGSFTNNDLTLLASATPTVVTGWSDVPWYRAGFGSLFGAAPNLLASKQTRAGAEGGWVRFDGISATSALLAIDERDDGERTHASEQVGYLAASGTGILSAEGPVTYEIGAGAAAEHEFTIRHAGAPGNQTYYFRLFDTVTDTPITATSSYPSLATEGATLTFSISGLPAGTTTEGVATDVPTTATSVPFGSLTVSSSSIAAHRLAVSTNAPRGYQILLGKRDHLTNGRGGTIPVVAASNTDPLPWESACDLTAFTGCWGYHTGDDTLGGGSTRFFLDDTYAAFSLSPEEVVYSGAPVAGQESDVVYRLEVSPDQPPGRYESSLQYLIVPTF
ncbi:hypothetical protein GVX82_00025, partial [Patescibacteria group bacterium]|nr:hypothetical protein [Patescibacteria group bacterium]